MSYKKAIKPGTLKAIHQLCEKEELTSSVSDCMTRMMTPEEWEKYGPLLKRENMGESKDFKLQLFALKFSFE